jgi:F-type H+-transporting ATPase subunit epsilon
VFHNHVVILADTAESARDIDVARAEDARRRAERRLQERQADVDLMRAESALLRAVNRIKIAQAG